MGQSSKDAFKLPTWEERGGEYVRRLQRDAALTIEQAAGLVGNLGYESAGFVAMQEIKPQVAGSLGGLGVAQWTGARRRAFEAWCAENALFPHSDEANYGFLLRELKGNFKGFASHLRLTRSIEDACRITHEVYERPADVLDGSYRSANERLAYARRALAGAKDGDTASTRELDAAIGDFEGKARSLQIHLQAAGYYHGKIDADWGPQSRQALADYKSR